MTPQVYDRLTGDGIEDSREGTLDLDDDDEAQHNQTNPSGFTFVAREDLDGIACRISANSEGLITAYLSTGGGTVLERRTIAALDPGETFTFETELRAGETYRIQCDARGRNYVRGRAEVDYPFESDLFRVTNGLYTRAGAESTSYRYCIDRIGPVRSTERADAIDLESDDQGQSWRSLTGRSGVRIRTAEAVDGLECRLSDRSEGLVTAYLTTDSDEVIERQTIATLEAGDTFAFETELEADETYRVVCDARGRSYVRGRAAVDYPFESDALEVTHGIYGGTHLSDSYRYCLDRIRPSDAGAAVHTAESETDDEDDGETETLELGSDEEGQSWRSLDDPSGVRLRTTEDVADVTCRLSAETEGVTTARLTDDAGEVLAERSIADLTAGETFTFDADLAGGEAYRILLDADGERYVRGRTAIEYPVASDVLEATHGIYSGDYESDSFRYCLDRITVSIAETEADEPDESEDDSAEPEPTESTVELDSDDEGQFWSSLDDPSGVRFRANTDLERLTCRISGESEGLTRARLTTDDEDVLAEQSLDDLAAGDEFTLEADLAGDETYRLLCDADGETFVRGRAEVDYPFEDELLSVTDGIYGGYLESDSFRYCVDRIVAERAASGSGSGGTETKHEENELDLGSDEEAQSWSSLDRPSGVRLRADEDVDALACRLSAETEGVTTAYLTDDDENVLDELSIEDLAAGETFAFDVDLEAGETYRVLCDADGERYVRGRSGADYPIADDLLAVTDGIYGGSYRSDSYRYCVDRIVAEREYEVPVDDEESDDVPDHQVATLELGDDEQGQSWRSLDDPSGVRFRAEAPVHTLECRLSAESEGLTTASLTDDDGEVLAERSIDDLAAGDEFVLEADLTAGEAYRILLDADGESYVRGRTPADYPIGNDLLEATHGIYSGDYESDSYRYCVDRIVAESGTPSDDDESEASEPDVPALELGDDEESQSWRSLTEPAGVRVRATADIDALECRLSAENEGLSGAYLTDDDGEVLAERSISGLGAGDTFVLNGGLEAGEAYRVVCDADGESFVRGRTAIDYPVESDALEATHGIYGGDHQTDGYRYCLDRIEPTEPVERETDAEPAPAPTPSASTHGLMAELTNRPDDVTTVNVAAESSIDEDGDLAAEILSYLDSQSEVNHEFVLPMGSYSWNTEFVVFDPIEFLEIRGAPRATLEVRDHGVDIAFLLGRWATDNPPKHVVLQNLDVDIADQSERDAGLISAHVGRCLLDNVELVGERWRHGPHGGDRYTCMINTRDPNALSLIRNLALPDGEIADSSQPSVGHSIGCSADPPHEGINIWDRCYVEEYVDNGLYVRNSEGENFVEHSMAVNCGNGNIRIGAADEARDCKILLDGGSDQTYPGAGLWLNGGEAIAERIEIDGTDAQNDIVRVNSDADGGHIKGLELFCGPDVQAPAIRCTETSSTTNRGLLIEDFEVEDITTAAGGSVRVRRSDVTLKDGTIDASYRPALTGYGDPDLEDVDMS